MIRGIVSDSRGIVSASVAAFVHTTVYCSTVGVFLKINDGSEGCIYAYENYSGNIVIIKQRTNNLDDLYPGSSIDQKESIFINIHLSKKDDLVNAVDKAIKSSSPEYLHRDLIKAVEECRYIDPIYLMRGIYNKSC